MSAKGPRLVPFQRRPTPTPALAGITAPTRTTVRERLNKTLDRLDVEQLQVAELVVDVIARGRM